MLSRIKEFIKKLSNHTTLEPEKQEEVSEEDLCCEGIVHIAYRGLADDRMYISYDRKWAEVKYFRQNSLRVFCAGCRRRVY